MSEENFLIKNGNTSHKLELFKNGDSKTKNQMLTSDFILETSKDEIINALLPDKTLPSQIKITSGDIFQHGFEEHDATALWLKTGFNSISVDIRYFIERLSALQINTFIHRNDNWLPTSPRVMLRIWEKEAPSLLKLSMPDGCSKYIYIHSNTKNGYAHTHEVASMTRNAIETLFALPVKSICMNGIEGEHMKHRASDYVDKIHAAIMLRTAKDHMALNPQHSDRSISFIDRGKGFLLA